VFAKDGVVLWSTRSATFTRKIREGRRLHRESIAWDFHATGKLDERDSPSPRAPGSERRRTRTSSNRDVPWLCIFENQTLMDDMQERSKLLSRVHREGPHELTRFAHRSV
jgi:hypothetical protein